MLIGPERPCRSGKATQLVVILHGWGADGANLIDLADAWAGSLPDAHFIAPNAPAVCEVNPFGYQWFGLNDRRPEAMLAGVRAAAEGLNAFLDAKLEALGLGAEGLALVGFSQGTMLALHAGLRRTPQIACILGYSGALIGGAESLQEWVSRPPVCLIHGQMDDVVPLAASQGAQTALRAAGVEAELHARPMLGHSIDMEGLEIGRKFLVKNLRA